MNENAIVELISAGVPRAGSPGALGGRREAVMRAGVSAVARAEGEIEARGPVLRFVASTGAVDRFEEVVDQRGWVLDAYRRNPVFMNAHRYGDAGQVIGRAVRCGVVEVDGGPALVIDVEFAVDVSPLARVVYGLYAGGFLNAVSVGFMPLELEEAPVEGSQAVRLIFRRQELLEVSAVAVPANPECLIVPPA